MSTPATQLTSGAMPATSPATTDIDDVELKTDTRPVIRLGFWALVVGFGLFLAWAAWAPLDEGVAAPATVSVEMRRKTIQHMQGGVVRELKVKEGAEVKQGDVLVVLDDAATRAGFETIRQNYLAQRAQESRLLAEASGATLVFHADLMGKNDAVAAQLMIVQRQLHASRRAALAAEVAAATQSMTGMEGQVNSIQLMLESRRNQQALQTRQVIGVKSLADEGFAPRNQALQLEQGQAEQPLARHAYQPVSEGSVLVLLIVSVAIHVSMVGLGLLFFGAEGARTPPFSDAQFSLGALMISGQQIWVVVASLALIVGLWLFFDRSLYGKALRATAINRNGARLMGFSPVFAGKLTFVLAAFIGVLSGILIAPLTTIYYDTGFLIGLKGFVAAIIGGLASYPLAAVGALLVGQLESFSSFWASAYKEVIVFTLIIPVLLWRSLTARHIEEEDDHGGETPGKAERRAGKGFGLLPLVASCDRGDIGGLSTALGPGGLPTVFVYDGHPGGAGFADRGYQQAAVWLGATLDAISACECPNGCPSCVQSPKCGNGNDPLDKMGAIAVLQTVLTALEANRPLDGRLPG